MAMQAPDTQVNAATPAKAADGARWRFGRFELRPHERLLLEDGKPAVLGARAFDVLLTLAENTGGLVTRQQLLNRVWAGLVVEEANLTVQVSSLRKLLGGDVITTIPGRGYRFTATLGVPETTPGATPDAAAASGPIGVATTGATPLSAAPATGPATAPVPAAAPAPPRVLSRHDELAELTQAVARPGCVTLAGPSGVGKTTLARALALADAQGVVWVDLAPLHDPAQVAGGLARALGLSVPDDLGSLAQAVGPRLLVLDNAELLADATAELLATLCAAAPGLRVLVTSQRPLALAVERVHRIQPLALPRDEPADLTQGAVALLVDRIRAADSRLQPGDGALPLLRQIVRRLDGLPLSIEMAAARVPMLGLLGVLDALDSRFALLTTGYRTAPGRHRSLLAALEWSHALLDAEEQRLFRICALFAGGFSLDLIVAVASDERHGRWEIIDTLAQLVDRSLVAVSTRDPPRYYLLESLRDFAAQRLAESADETALRRRHAEVLSEMAPPYHRIDVAARRALLAEHDNLREAAAWTTRRAPGLAAEMTAKIANAARFASWRTEAAIWLDAVAACIDDPSVTPSQRAEWWLERAAQQVMSYDPRSSDTARHALGLCQALGDDAGAFKALIILIRSTNEATPELQEQSQTLRELLQRHPEWPPGRTLSFETASAVAAAVLGDHETSLAHRVRAVQLADDVGLHDDADASRANIVNTLVRLKRPDEALAHSTELLARIGDSGSPNAAYAWQEHLGALIALGQLPQARQALARMAPLQQRYDLPFTPHEGAMLLAAEGRHADAVRLLGYSCGEFDRRRLVAEPVVVNQRAEVLRAAARAQPGLDTDDLQRQGAALSASAMLQLLGLAPAAG